jgi:hypothetical protein
VVLHVKLGVMAHTFHRGCHRSCYPA